MKTYRTYQFKLKPNASQIKIFEEWLGICRYVYNNSLSVREHYLRLRKKQPSSFDLNYQLNDAKKEQQLNFLKTVHSDVLADASERTKKTVDKLLSTWSKGKKSYFKYKKSFEYNSFTFKRSVVVEQDFIKLPKIGKVKYFNSRDLPLDSKIKYSSIIRKNNNWFINIQIELSEQPPLPIDESQAVGIDVGIEVFAYLSNGYAIKGNYPLEQNIRKLRVLQRALSRCKKGSNRRQKIKNKLSKLHEKIANQRKDFNHKVSSKLAYEFDLIVIEDLRISNMIKLNSTLSRRMLDNAFFQFRCFLDYKVKELIAVNPAYTSQTCNSCGYVDKKSRISQAEFVCTNCGVITNADLNASKNILASGRSYRTKRKSID